MGENEWFSTWVLAFSCVSTGRRFDLATACPERIEGLCWTVNGDSAEWCGCQSINRASAVTPRAREARALWRRKGGGHVV